MESLNTGHLLCAERVAWGQREKRDRDGGIAAGTKEGREEPVGRALPADHFRCYREADREDGS